MMELLELLAALVLLAIVHELGHVAMARLFGVVVPRVQIGAGYTLLERKGKRTIWAVGWTLIGGYTRIHGMDAGDAKLRTGGDYRELHPMQQLLVVLGGVLANLVLTAGIHIGLALYNGATWWLAIKAGAFAPLQVIFDAALKWGSTLGIMDVDVSHIPVFDGTLYAWLYCTATLSLLAALLNLLPTQVTDGGRAWHLLRGDE